MTDPYCPICFRTLPPGRDACTACERQVAVVTGSRLQWLLYGVAVSLLVIGMLTFNLRLCTAGAALAVVGIVLRLARL